MRGTTSIETSPGNAIRMFVFASNRRGSFPFDPSSPYGLSTETLAAMDDAITGRNLPGPPQHGQPSQSDLLSIISVPSWLEESRRASKGLLRLSDAQAHRVSAMAQTLFARISLRIPFLNWDHEPKNFSSVAEGSPSRYLSATSSIVQM